MRSSCIDFFCVCTFIIIVMLCFIWVYINVFLTNSFLLLLFTYIRGKKNLIQVSFNTEWSVAALQELNISFDAFFDSNAHLKKSFLQQSRPSLEKHLSVKLHLQSQHCTHLACQALSKTLSRNLSRIGLSHPAQWTIFCDSSHHVPILGGRQKSACLVPKVREHCAVLDPSKQKSSERQALDKA